MSKQEFEVIKKLEEVGYRGTVVLGESGYFMKIKRILNSHPKSPDDLQPTSIEPKAFAIAQKYGYQFKEVGAEEYEKGSNSRIVPFVFFVKQYPYE
jgi:hypothetical protein